MKVHTLFLAWQDTNSRRWYPIGRLTENGCYRFQYLRGVEEAAQHSQFHALPSFPDVNRVYESKELFPLFVNRVMPQNRADYPNYVEWLHLNGDSQDPLAFLGKSGGRKATDTLETFPDATSLEGGRQCLHFFVHGVRHMSPESLLRAEQLTTGERLLPMWDAQNPQDPDAIALRTYNAPSGDASLIGFCPRYIAAEVLAALRSKPDACKIEVVKVNLSPAPTQFRVLCRMELSPDAGVVPFSSASFAPVPTT
jgi:hypothetical protein